MALSTIHARYRKAVAKNLKPFYANWMPGQERALGDYGTFDNGIFIREGNVRDLGLPFEEMQDPNADMLTFTEGGNTSMSLSAAGSVPELATATVKLTLENSATVYFQALDARSNTMRDKVDFGRRLIAYYHAHPDQWLRKWVVITDIVAAGRTIAFVSTQSAASVELAAQAEIPVEAIMVDADVHLSIKTAHNVGYQVIGNGMQVLIGVSKIRGWFHDQFEGKQIADGAVAVAEEDLIFAHPTQVAMA